VTEGNNSPETADQPLTTEQAAKRLAGSILDSEPAAPIDPDSEAEETEAENAEVEAAADEPTEDEADEAEGGDEGEYEEADEPADEDEELYAVEINGEEVNLDEVGKGYLRQSDYTKKTQEVAAERKALDAEKASIAAERNHLKQMLEMAQHDAIPEPDWVQLATDDPLEYTRLKAIHDAVTAEREAKQAEANRLSNVERHEQTVKIQQHIQEQGEMLAQKMPDMAGEKGAQKRADIRTFMEGLGYSNEELAQLFDHRIVLAFDALREKEAMKSNKPLAKKKVKGKPKVLKPGAKKSKKVAADKQVQQAKNRLRKSGSVDDAVALLMG